MKIPIVALRVRDQDSALRFYTETLGFTVREDMDLGPMRWLTVSPPDQPDLEVLLERPGPPFFDADAVRCVDVIQEPMERFYGIDAGFRDDSGNHVRLTERVETGIAPPA